MAAKMTSETRARGGKLFEMISFSHVFVDVFINARRMCMCVLTFRAV